LVDEANINKDQVSRFPIVGVGASAGGLEALTDFLKNLPADLNMAIVIIQHLDPNYQSKTSEILARNCRYPVKDAQNNTEVEVNTVYVLTSNTLLRLKNRRLRTFPREHSASRNMPINIFFNSLAEDLGEDAVGIILSGSANDGSEGIHSIKLEGGITLAQLPESAKYSGMPESAIATGLVDFVLIPKEIAQKLQLIKTIVGRDEQSESLVKEGLRHQTAFQELLILIKRHQHCDFTNYKSASIERRILRRIAVLGKKDIIEYLDFFKKDPEECKKLVSDILIHVTSFFRDEETYAKLKSDTFPEILSNKIVGEEFRVWVPGCSSGEEAYSLAMIFFEVVKDKNVILKIIASDISNYVIQKARRGIYPKSIEEQVSKERLSRFFEKLDDGYKVKGELRDACLFSPHDCTNDPPFSKMDFISCRNLLIYFSAKLQKNTLSILHYSLNEHGVLLLGSAESVGETGQFFVSIDKKYKLYRKVNQGMKNPMVFSHSRQKIPSYNSSLMLPTSRIDEKTITQEVRSIGLREFVPANFVVNSATEVIESNGNTAPYVEMSKGAASLNLYKLIKPCYVVDLRLALVECLETSLPVKRQALVAVMENQYKRVDIKIFPVKLAFVEEPYFSIYLNDTKEVTSGGISSRGRASDSRASKDVIDDLQFKLSESLAYQSSLTDSFEETQGDLIVSNEELQSANEELQSINEEMETIQEEMLSTNEELKNLNGELEKRNKKEVESSEDISNLFSCLEVSVIIVDKGKRIRKFTPAAQKLFNLQSVDIGRSLSDLNLGIQSINIRDLIDHTILTKEPFEREVQNEEGLWFNLRIKPYFKENNVLNGAVVTFIDVNILKSGALLIKEGHDDDLSIISKMTVSFLVLSEHMNIKLANDEFCKTFKVSKEFCAGLSVYDLCRYLWNGPQVEDLIEKASKAAKERSEFLVDVLTSDDEIKHLKFVFQRITLSGSQEEASLLSIEDLTDEFTTERALRISEEKYRKTLARVQRGVILVNEKGKVEFVNDLFVDLFGYSSEELRNQHFKVLLFEKHQKEAETYFKLVLENPIYRVLDKEKGIVGRHKYGREILVDLTVEPFVTDGRTLVACNVLDITESRRIEEEQQSSIDRERILREEAEVALQVKENFLASISHELFTPLSTILTWSEMLRLGKVTKEKEPDVYASIENSANVQKQLINDLLETSRVKAGKLFLNLTEINLVDTLKGSIEILSPMAKERRIEIKLKYSNTTNTIWADSTRLNQVFCNILTNAIKFSKVNRKIEVEVSEDDNQDGKILIIEFKDKGKGIAREYLSHIFERFSQEDRKITRQYGGLGLGLSIVQNLVCMHGGWVDVSSPGLGKGTTFTVRLPVKTEACVKFKSSGVEKRFQVISKSKDPAILDGTSVLFFDINNPKANYFKIMLRSLGAFILDDKNQASSMEDERNVNIDIVIFCSEVKSKDIMQDNIAKLKELVSFLNLDDTPSLYMGSTLTDTEAMDLFNIGLDGALTLPVDAIFLSKIVSALIKR